MGNLTSKAIASITTSIGGLVDGGLNSLQKAMQNQISLIGTAGDLARMTGLSFAQSQSYLSGVSGELAKIAGALPGATSDYVSLAAGISDNLVPAFKALSGAVDISALREAQLEISKFGALRANFSGVDGTDASLGISKALAGASISELNTLRFFEQNPAVLSQIENEAAKLGKELKDLSARQRADVIRSALKVQDDVIEAATNSAEGIVSGFLSSIFDPTSGMLGLQRTFKLFGKQTTILDELTESFRLIMGPDGIAENLLRAFKIEPGSDGLLKFVGTQITKFNKWLIEFRDNLKIFREFPDIPGIQNILVALKYSGVNDFGEKVGKALARIINGFFGLLINVEKNPNVEVSRVEGQIRSFIFDVLVGFFDSLTLRTILVGGLIAAAAAAVPILAGMAVTALAGLLGATALAAFAGPIGILIAIAGVVLVKVIRDNWGNIGTTLSNLWQGLGEWFADTTKWIWEGIVNFFSPIGEFFKAIGDVAGDRIRLIVDLHLKFWDALKFGFEKLRGMIPTWLGGTLGLQAAPYTANPSYSIGGRANGNITDLIKRELSMAPSGSLPVIANDSELILNRAQQSALVNSINNQGSGGVNLSGISITINDQTGDIKRVASQVVEEIGRQVRVKRMTLGVV